MTDWLNFLVGTAALVVAAFGYKELIKSKKDTDQQIQQLTRNANETSRIASLQYESQESERRLLLPRFKYSDYSYYVGPENKMICYITLTNFGKSPAIDVKSYVSDEKLDFTGVNGTFIISGEQIKLTWHSKPGQKINESIETRVYFSDSFNIRYIMALEITAEGKLNFYEALKVNDKDPNHDEPSNEYGEEDYNFTTIKNSNYDT